MPALDFEIRATLRCEGRPVSLTLSVADVYLSFGPDSLGDEGRLEATIRVPPDQLALVIAGSSFCLGDTAQTGETLLVPGVATAQASLQCASEDGGNSMHFASAPLPLRLTCMTAEPAGQSETPPAR